MSRRASAAFFLFSGLASVSFAQAPVGTAFTYQGRLTDGGAPATGNYDLEVKLFDAGTAGTQVGSTVTLTNVMVSNGLFTASLDFGAVFGGSQHFLEIGVRPGGSSGAFTVLVPRQELTPVPNAAFASNATTIAGLTCTSGQVAKWIGSRWTCGADDDTNSGGTVTNVTAGAGLSGGTISSSGTIAVATGGITSTMIGNGAVGSAQIASGAVGSAQIASGAVGSAQIDTTQVQTRVSGTCPAGSTIQQINGDGTVVCQTAAAQPGFATATLDSTGDVGEYTSITIGTDGLGLISYYDNTNKDLKVAHCSNTACSTATTATLDSTGDVGQYTSITIGTDGLGLISYYDNTNHDLKVAHCSNTACTSASNTTALDSAGDVGQYTSITVEPGGGGLISYYDVTNQDLKVAHCANTACTSTTNASTLDSTGSVGQYTSITIGTDGRGLISYFDVTNGDLKVAHCSSTFCTALSSAASVDSTGVVGQFTSITIGTDGFGLVSYYDSTNSHLKAAHCTNTGCTTFTAATADSTGAAGWYSSITIGTDGLGLISNWDSNSSDLKVTHCSSTACSTATSATVDSAVSVGFYTSITIGTDGFGLVSYQDLTNLDLKVAHCSNTLCSPFVVRRR
jgi:hypothetical protein